MSFRCRRGNGRGQPARLTGKTSLAEEIAGPEERDDTLLALIGDDGELNPAGLDIVDCVGRVALAEDDILRIQLRIGSETGKADSNNRRVKVRRFGDL